MVDRKLMAGSVFFFFDLQKKQLQQSTNENGKGNTDLPKGIRLILL